MCSDIGAVHIARFILFLKAVCLGGFKRDAAALSLAQVIIITGGKCYFELVKSDHKRGGITFEAAKANGFQEQDASDNVDSAFI